MDDSAKELERRIYVDVLKLPGKRSPPNHYDLLGLSVGEANRAAIERGAKVRVAALRKDLPPELRQPARLVLRRIATARICLLDGNARAAYDATLQRSSSNRAHVDTKAPSAPTPEKSVQSATPRENAHKTSLDRPHRVEPRSPPPQAQDSGAQAFSAAETTSDEYELEDPIPKIPLSPIVTVPELDSASIGQPKRWRSEHYALVSIPVVSILIAFVAWHFLSSKGEAIKPDQNAASKDRNLIARSHELLGRKPKLLPESNNAKGHGSAPQVDPATSAVAAPGSRPPDRSASARTSFSTSVPSRVTSATDRKESTTDVANLTVNSGRPQGAQTAEVTSKAFEELPNEVTLPALRSPESALADGGKLSVDLGPIGGIDPSVLQVALQQPVSEQGDATRFDIVPATDAEHPNSWEIRLRSQGAAAAKETSALDKVGQGIDEVIARLYIEDGVLKFTWTATRYPNLADQLRNCVIALNGASEKHTIQLRPCTRLAPIVLDLENPSQQITLSEGALPPSSSLFMEVLSLEDFNVKVEKRPTDGVVPFGHIVRVSLKDWKRAAEIRIKFGGARDSPSVFITAHYKLDRRWQPLTHQRVNKAGHDLSKAMAKGRSRLEQAKARTRDLPPQISSLEAQAQTREGATNARLHTELKRQRSQLKSAQSTIRRFSRLLPKIESQLPLLKELAEIQDKLHQAARIQFRIGVKMDDGDLDLLRTGEEVSE